MESTYEKNVGISVLRNSIGVGRFEEIIYRDIQDAQDRSI